MGVYCYADDLSLICPSFSGLTEMLNICDLYAKQYGILFNAKKSQLLLFDRKHREKDKVRPKLYMPNGELIPYVDECAHLGNIINTNNSSKVIEHAKKDIYIRTNVLLSDFSFTESSTLSVLFNTYCMNMYGSSLWKHYDNKMLDSFYTAWRKCIRRIWKISNRTHTALLQFIQKCNPIDVILDKRCIKFIWKLMNSDYSMYRNIVNFSVCNSMTTMSENIRYFMFKYQFSYDDWSNSIIHIYKTIDNYVNKNVNLKDKCFAMVVR